MKRNFDGKQKTGVRPTSDYHEFIKTTKARHPVRNQLRNIDLSTLNFKQKKIYDSVKGAVENPSGIPYRLIVSGVGGTGKSHTIHALKGLFVEKKVKYRIFSATGSSAFQVGGNTFHNGMRLPYFLRSAQPNANLKAAKQALKGVSWYIFDEMSLIGKFMLGFVSERLKLINGNSLPFGGVNVIMMGDFGQLRPVADTPGYLIESNLEGMELAGGLAYNEFNHSVLLNEMMRQGPEEQEFRELLLRMRGGRITNADVEALSQRHAALASEAELADFASHGIALFAEHDSCDRFNSYRLEALGNPIFDFAPQDSCTSSATPSSVLRLCVGAKVCLNQNVWTEAGLYNGALGVVTEIPDNGDDPPDVIFVKFQTYLGPKFLLRDDVPIIATKKCEFSANGKSFTRIQFPLMLSFAITVHKAQGCTLDRVIIGIEQVGFRSLMFRLAPTLMYVACSRVRRWVDILFSNNFRKETVMARDTYYFNQFRREEARLATMEI